MTTRGLPDEADVFAAAAELGQRLRGLGLKICTAESCTGGLASRALTEIGGSSEWFERGFVTYSNASKEELLGVSAASLATHGAVSEPVAREMARGALQRSRADVALAITGIAGPGGGAPGKPVGTVCFGWARAAPATGPATALGRGSNGTDGVGTDDVEMNDVGVDDIGVDGVEVLVQTCVFGGDRADVRRQAALHALDGVARMVTKGRGLRLSRSIVGGQPES